MRKNNTVSAVAGIALTMAAAGGMAYMMSSKNMKSQRRQIKKQALKAANTISDWAENVSHLMG